MNFIVDKPNPQPKSVHYRVTDERGDHVYSVYAIWFDERPELATFYVNTQDHGEFHDASFNCKLELGCDEPNEGAALQAVAEFRVEAFRRSDDIVMIRNVAAVGALPV